MTRTVEAPPILHAEEPVGASRVAVIVCHGMGQQVPFETLGVFVDTLQRAARQKRLPDELCDVTVSERAVHMLPFGDRLLPLARLAVTCPDVRPRVLDLYEAYWAPVTAGRVRLIDSILFYLNAGRKGIQFALGGVFERRVAQRLWHFPLKPLAALKLAFALDLLVLLALAIVATELLALFLALNLSRVWTAASILDTAPFLLSYAVLTLGVLVAGIVVAILVSAIFGRPSPSAAPAPAADKVSHRRGILFRLVQLIVPLILVPGAIVALGMAANPWREVVEAGFRGALIRAPYSMIAGGVLLIVGLLLTRWFLIEYTGDVAAYMSAHRVSRFAEIRNEIQARCCRVMNFVYGLRRADGHPEYDEVIVVGHSLGSVIAYDTLNDIIARDRAGDSVNAAARTSLLLTFGSPLDKIAFIFRSQKPSEMIDIREELAAERQPMVQRPEFRPARWVNIYHPVDWIASPLDYFDLQPRVPNDPRRTVTNIAEKGFRTPDRAHQGYWRRPTLERVLLWAAAGFPGKVPSGER